MLNTGELTAVDLVAMIREAFKDKKTDKEIIIWFKQTMNYLSK